MGFEVLILLVAVAGCALFISGCGSGSQSGPPPPPPNGALRTDLFFGYFGTNIAETVDHTNLVFAGDWFGPDVQLQQVIEAKNAGLPVMLHVDGQTGFSKNKPFDSTVTENLIRQRFIQLRDAGVLDSVIALYIDEVTHQGYTEEHVKGTTTAFRKISAEFGVSPNLASFYDASLNWVGVSYWDWVGFDNYDHGDKIFTNGELDKLRAVISPAQKIMIVAGGADPWRTDPTLFFNAAQQDPRIIAVFGWTWIDGSDAGYAAGGWGKGIRSNGMAPIFKAIGIKIKTGKNV